MQTSLQNYIQGGNYKQFIMNSAAAPIDESTYTVTPLPATEAAVARADVLAACNRERRGHERLIEEF